MLLKGIPQPKIVFQTFLSICYHFLSIRCLDYKVKLTFQNTRNFSRHHPKGFSLGILSNLEIILFIVVKCHKIL